MRRNHRNRQKMPATRRVANIVGSRTFARTRVPKESGACGSSSAWDVGSILDISATGRDTLTPSGAHPGSGTPEWRLAEEGQGQTSFNGLGQGSAPTGTGRF